MIARDNTKLIVCIVYVATMFMVAMDANVLNVALPAIGHDMGTAPSATGTINVGYMVSLAIMLTVAGWLGDRFGTKKIFVLALIVFTTSSVLCGLTADLGTLTLFRIIQGASGGLLTPVAMTILFRTFPPAERTKLSRYLVFPIAIAPALGPIIGGYCVDYLTWRWVFYVNLPIGIVAVLFAYFYLQDYKGQHTGRMDWTGFLLAALGIGGLVYALNSGFSAGWSNVSIIAALIIGAASTTALIVYELRVSSPMLQLRLLQERLFRTMMLISACTAAGLLGMLYVFPLLYQDALGASAFDSGLTTFPEALGLMIASQVVARSYHRFGPRLVITCGLISAAIGYGLLCSVTADTSPWLIRGLLLWCGFCLGHVVSSVQFAIFANIPPASMGGAAALFTVQNRLSSGIGLTLLVCILGALGAAGTGGEAASEPTALGAYHAALLSAAVLLLIACGLAQRIRKADVERTMKPRTKPVDESGAVGAAAGAGVAVQAKRTSP
ncbi:multidrug efflux MFS transporter (plasmid) [Paenibacillus cellulosilyticus]|nr:multidrug efflux MFS transporter [Paenibacillus cellulosilyticus]